MSEPFRRPESGHPINPGNPGNNAWLHCSACRKDIPFQSVYWACSVSTCNRARMQLVFCSVACWDSHLSTLRHREAWAVEERAPTRAEWLAGRGEAGAGAPSHRSEAPTVPLHATTVPPAPRAPVTVATSAVASAMASASATASSSARVMPPAAPVLSSAFEREILIVVSKMKKYIKERSGMNSSDAVAEALGDHVRAVCDQAIQAAAADGRKTVLDRDVPPAPRR